MRQPIDASHCVIVRNYGLFLNESSHRHAVHSNLPASREAVIVNASSPLCHCTCIALRIALSDAYLERSVPKAHRRKKKKKEEDRQDAAIGATHLKGTDELRVNGNMRCLKWKAEHSLRRGWKTALLSILFLNCSARQLDTPMSLHELAQISVLLLNEECKHCIH